jgi:hypothetical protein
MVELRDTEVVVLAEQRVRGPAFEVHLALEIRGGEALDV